MNSEERQAAIDALTDILRSRGKDENSPIGTGHTTNSGKLKIDPNLIYPALKFPGEDHEDLNINDPKGLLSKLKQNKPKNNTESNIPSSNEHESDNNESDNKGDDSGDDRETTGNSTSSGKRSEEQSAASDKKTTKSSSADNANANDDYAEA